MKVWRHKFPIWAVWSLARLLLLLLLSFFTVRAIAFNWKDELKLFFLLLFFKLFVFLFRLVLLDDFFRVLEVRFVGNPTDELKELNKNHVLGAWKIALGVLHCEFGEAPARRDSRVSDHHRAAHRVLLRDVLYTLNELQGSMLREKPLI